ncbi:gfo/Idh/MocA family oxidoreductase, partial [Xylella fastidiosa subsp. multiplex]|nr:gfo/Idh/MocA family oxidoreductase [Xylella fastidiosa subsp. multiplex]
LAAQWDVPRVFASIEEAAAQDAIFDIAAPPVVHCTILNALPHGASVLLQKPMGLTLADASAIRAVCRERELIAAVNFQLRCSPMMLAVADA